MWWRAISATYMLRPNKETLALIEQHRDPVVKKANGTLLKHVSQKYVNYVLRCQVTASLPTYDMGIRV